MPFDEEDNVEEKRTKSGVKNVSSQKSIFENKPKKPTLDSFKQTVAQVEENKSVYRKRANELASSLLELMNDKTLAANKNIIQKDVERETLSNLLKLAEEINNDENENEGTGSLFLNTLLFKCILLQRDKINALEYEVSKLIGKHSTKKVPEGT